MSENTPETPDATPEPSAPDDVDSKDATGVGVYDTTLQRFVGGVFPDGKAAKAYVDDKGAAGHHYVTRKV